MENTFVPHLYDDLENLDVEKFINFNNTAKDVQGWFTYTSVTESGCFCDAYAINKTGGTLCLEFKYREPKYITASNIYIEPRKYINLMELYVNYGITPAYINFFGDEYVGIWLLPLVDLLIPEIVNINGKPQLRFGLCWDYAYRFYKEDGKWVLWRKPINLSKIQKSVHYTKLCKGCKTPEDFINNNEIYKYVKKKKYESHGETYS